MADVIPGRQRRRSWDRRNQRYQDLLVAWQREGGGPRSGNLALTLLWNLACRHNRSPTDGNWESLREVQQQPHQCSDLLGELWGRGGGSSYQGRCRSLLTQALILAGLQPLAQMVQPLWMAPRGAGGLQVLAEHSAEGAFALHDCIPRRAKLEGRHSLAYRVQCALAEQLIPCLRSVSKLALRKRMCFLHELLAPVVAEADGSWTRVWELLRGLNSVHLLSLFERLLDTPGGTTTTTSRNVFRRRLHLLRILHSKVLQPGSTDTIPCLGGGYYAFSETVVSDDEDDDGALAPCVGGDNRLHQTMARLRRRIQRGGDGRPDQEPVFAFTPPEVRSILRACCTTREQLIVLLLLTTGLRLGGLCRLRLPTFHRAPSAGEVPRQLPTIEKNGRQRMVLLTDACRILVSRWLTETASWASGGNRLFPGRRPETTVTPGHVWRLCRVVFRRARLVGEHVHPHTFRHTLVHLLHMGGTSFEDIAKFIGHASPTVTSAVYGRLRQQDVLRTLRGVPFLSDAQALSQENDWKSIAKLLEDPWHCTNEEWGSLRPKPVVVQPNQDLPSAEQLQRLLSLQPV